MMKYTNHNGLTLPVWESFTTEGFLDELKALHAEGLLLADKVAELESPTFNDLVVRFEELDRRRILHIRTLGHMKSVNLEAYPGISEVEEESFALESAYGASLDFHQGLYRAYLFVRNHEFDVINDEQQYIVTKGIKKFERNGVGLPKADQDRLRALKEEIARDQSLFETQVVQATDGWSLHVTDAKRLSGVPEDVITSAAKLAEAKGLPGFLLSQKTNVFITVLDYATDRTLREEFWKAFTSRATETSPLGDVFNNGPVMLRLLRSRAESAHILGLPSHAANSILTKMSGAVGVDGVSHFLETLATASFPKSHADRQMLSTFAAAELGITEMGPWDVGFVSRLYKDKHFAIDDEEVRGYFPASKVIEGLLGLIQRLFGCVLREAHVSVWHPSVRFFEVCDQEGKVFGGFYIDLLARPGKRGGAWMDDLGWRIDHDGTQELPVAFLCCNFRTSSDGGESYLLHDDVVTVFHETGHVFHHLLAKTNYFATAMSHVEWDAIELPSQLLEHWAWKRDMLRSMSSHKQTGAPLPDALIDTMIQLKDYIAGLAYGRQFGLALFDWNVHKNAPADDVAEIMTTFRNALFQASAFPVHESARGPYNFTHAFGGGYDAGYFSYSWANSLVADVAAAFDEAGSDGEVSVATRYRDEILAKGASRPIIESFRAFRGRDPEPKYLIPYIGLD